MSKYVLTNALLIDGTGAEPKPNHGLVIDGDSIHSVDASGSLAAPADAEVIDLEGKTLMPGIIDAHTHLTYHRSEYGLLLLPLPPERALVDTAENEMGAASVQRFQGAHPSRSKLSPVARGLLESQASISDDGQRTARWPTLIGRGNKPSRIAR